MLNDPSMRRFLALISGIVLTAANAPANLHIDTTQIGELLALIGLYIGAGNLKAAAEAKAAGAAAAASVTTLDQANAVMKAAADSQVKP